MEKLSFTLLHYALLGVVAFAAYGLGRPLTESVSKYPQLPSLLIVALSIASGIGVTMVVLFVAGTFQVLNAVVVASVVTAGSAVAITFMIFNSTARQKRRSVPAAPRMAAKQSFWGWAIAVVCSLYLIPKSLQPPHQWDDVMYHLPYARFWAERGALSVNEWLRYPLFPYNMNLLYAGALVFDNDILPQLLHGFCAVLTVALTYSIGKLFLDWRVGVVAAVQVAISTSWGWDNAFVDLGLMLFWSAAFAALALLYKYRDSRFSYLAAFFSAIAVGIKYQALFYLPVFLVLALSIERRIGVLFRSAMIVVFVGGYWYLRNFLISGDPFHPIGGHIFGFWLWDEDDFARQFADLESRRALPEWFLCLSIGALLFWRNAGNFERGLMATTAGSVLIWAWASGYTRYLVSVYPMLALLSAIFLMRAGLMDAVAAIWQRVSPRHRAAIPALLFVVAFVSSYGQIAKYWERIAPDENARVTYLTGRYPGFSLLQSTGLMNKGVLYQHGFEEEIYYLGESVRGEHFGRGRYRDVERLANDSHALANHLEELGIDNILVERVGGKSRVLMKDPDWQDYFELAGRSEHAVLYRLKKGQDDDR